MYIAVLYSNLHVAKVSWEERNILKRTEVLSIAIIHSDKPQQHKRQQAVCEYDYYVLAWTDDDCYLGGYNDDFYWFSLTEPWKPYGEGFWHRFPYELPQNSILFKGVMVAPEIYAKAKAIFGDRNGPMF